MKVQIKIIKKTNYGFMGYITNARNLQIMSITYKIINIYRMAAV